MTRSFADIDRQDNWRTRFAFSFIRVFSVLR